MNESAFVMMCTQKKILLKNDLHIHVSRICESNVDVPFCHRHDFFAIEHVIEGSCLQYINGKEYTCAPGSICLLSPFDEHRYYIPGKATIDYLCFADDAVFSEVWNILDLDKAPYTAQLSETDFHRMTADFDVLKEELEQKKSLYQSNAKGIVNKVIVNIIRNAIPTVPPSHCQKTDLREALSYIRYHFREPLTLEGMAGMFHVTPSHFCKYFKANTNSTFKEYLLALRLDYAMRLIQTTDKNISEIYHESGFSSPSYFSKVFKERFGKSPSQVKQEIV